MSEQLRHIPCKKQARLALMGLPREAKMAIWRVTQKFKGAKVVRYETTAHT